MTQEEKAKAYDEALERARELSKTTTGANYEYIFPELKESREERIKNDVKRAISVALDYSYFDKETADNCLAWLEKQRDKPTDKVQPKFHEGDWIVQKKIGVYKVIEVCESWYEVADNKDKYYSIGFDKEYVCHLWTIQDAKDGDVLVASDGSMFVFAGIRDARCLFHIACKVDGHLVSVIRKSNCGESIACVKPATKEQCNLLFANIKEAGYEWDSETKELKKTV